MIVAFTGPSHLTDIQERHVQMRMSIMEAPTVVRTGAAMGADTVAALQAVSLWPQIDHVVFVPHAPHNPHILPILHGKARAFKAYACPEGSSPALSYRKRNELMVTDCDLLVAFLTSPTFYRSGEWMTVNIAKKLGVDISYYILPNA